MYQNKVIFNSWSSTHINMPVVINFLRTVRYLHTHEMAARLAFYYSWNIFTARKKLLRTYNLWKIFYNWAPKAQKFWHFMSKIPYFRILSWEWAHKTEGVPWGGTPKKPIFRNWGGGHPKPPPPKSIPDLEWISYLLERQSYAILKSGKTALSYYYAITDFGLGDRFQIADRLNMGYLRWFGAVKDNR